MRFLMMVKAPENSGPPPKELMDAMGKLAEEAMKSGEMIETGGLGPTAAGSRVRLSGTSPPRVIVIQCRLLRW